MNLRIKSLRDNTLGSPQLFQNPPKLQTSSLSLGSAIHECILQGDEFELAPKVNKPTAKLGMVMDNIQSLLKSNDDINEVIKNAALKVDYFTKNIDSKIKIIKETWEEYSSKVSKLQSQSTKKLIFLSDSDYDIANACIQSLKSNQTISNILQPINTFGENYEFFNEDALFIDFIVTYKEKQCAIIPFKLKIDNWTINDDTMTISLNDLKTTGKTINQFMENSFEHYRYYRQLGVYMSILELYVNKEYGISPKTGWTFESNICAVETIPNYWSRCFKINDEDLHRGINEFTELLKRVAYYEIAGYDSEVSFI